MRFEDVLPILRNGVRIASEGERMLCVLFFSLRNIYIFVNSSGRFVDNPLRLPSCIGLKHVLSIQYNIHDGVFFIGIK